MLQYRVTCRAVHVNSKSQNLSQLHPRHRVRRRRPAPISVVPPEPRTSTSFVPLRGPFINGEQSWFKLRRGREATPYVGGSCPQGASHRRQSSFGWSPAAATRVIFRLEPRSRHELGFARFARMATRLR
jgi:hypothetical protein